MTHSSFESATPIVNWETVKKSKEASNCMIPMGITSENVARRFKISRDDQDEFAFQSHKKAAYARKMKLFSAEIIPINGVFEDDGIRDDTSVLALKKLKPVFQRGGTTTAGNSSQVCYFLLFFFYLLCFYLANIIVFIITFVVDIIIVIIIVTITVISNINSNIIIIMIIVIFIVGQ
jgi:hypothetical protein